MAKKVFVLLADGFEEIEAITPIDVLRRAGIDVKVVGVPGRTVTGSHGIAVQADITLDECDGNADAVILPGGMPGSRNLKDSPKVANLVKRMHQDRKVVGAICAAPALALGPAGVLEGRQATCYPGFEKEFPATVKFKADRVVVDGNVITSRGPGTAMEFALELVEILVDKGKAATLREALLAKA